VSRQITALEDFLGMALFRRTRHGVALTPAGADYARQIARQLDTMERDTLDAMAAAGQGGSLAAGRGADLRHPLADPAAAGLRGRHPTSRCTSRRAPGPSCSTTTAFDAALYAGTPAQAANWAGTPSTAAAQRGRAAGLQPALLRAARAVVARGGRAAAAAAAEHPRPTAGASGSMPSRSRRRGARSGPRYELFSMLASAPPTASGVALMPRMLIEAELRAANWSWPATGRCAASAVYFLVTPAGPGRTARADAVSRLAARAGGCRHRSGLDARCRAPGAPLPISQSDAPAADGPPPALRARPSRNG
jgi:DNA-binding transcriptional LysR family regulator